MWELLIQNLFQWAMKTKISLIKRKCTFLQKISAEANVEKNCKLSIMTNRNTNKIYRVYRKNK